MERIEILNKLNKIFCEILDLDEVTLTDDTSANDIEEWDSLAQIQLIVAIEKAFSIKFNSQEILIWKNVGAMIDCILSKL
jgi:acyl carrier protein